MRYPKKGLQGSSAQKCKLAGNLLYQLGLGQLSRFSVHWKWAKKRRGRVRPTVPITQPGVTDWSPDNMWAMTGSCSSLNLCDEKKGSKFPETLSHHDAFPLWN